VSLGIDVISVKQMTATRRSPSEGSTTIKVPLFLLTMLRTAKSEHIFRLQSPCLIAIRVEALRSDITGAVRPGVGKLQATSPLLVVRRRSPAKGMPRERKYIFHLNTNSRKHVSQFGLQM
jgi:hypothetical protein